MQLGHLLFSNLLLLVFYASQINSQTTTNQLICPDVSLQEYLIDLIDVLYANGLTEFEQVLVNLSESDSGYSLLESIYSTSPITLLAPTDSALQKSNLGITNPTSNSKSSTSNHLGADQLTDLVALHVLRGTWGYNVLSNSPNNGVASSFLSMGGYLNDTTTGSNAFQVDVLSQANDGAAVIVEMVSGNATSWNDPLDLSSFSSLGNLVILPVDTVISFPPPLSAALTLSTTSASTNGLTKLSAAFSSFGGAFSLETLTPAGFTIFAPVDAAFTSSVATQLSSSGAIILGNHYTTTYSLYSPAWISTGSFPSLNVESGSSLAVISNSSGSFVSLGNVTAKILRSDIPLANGVMHIIDTVLVSSSSTLISLPVSSISSITKISPSSSNLNPSSISNPTSISNITASSAIQSSNPSSASITPSTIALSSPSSSTSDSVSIPAGLVGSQSSTTISPISAVTPGTASSAVSLRRSFGSLLVGLVGCVWLGMTL